ncbi:hypothetical protein [Micromonospora sp. M71_S20]|uniref:hypothetical protein n=1 Tax=Micromonospora sp. M71_S20 TaxID=592872 RepID=UPI001F24E78A|nr:hypothetical protein [Micromonospora sp. M71_S20]
MSFNAMRTLTGCLLDIEASADLADWGHPPLLLLVQDQPAPTASHRARRHMRVTHLPVNDRRMSRYRAGLAEFLPDLAAALEPDRPVARPTLAACVDISLIADLLADPTPGLRLVAWAVCYEDVLVEPDELHEIRRIDAVDIDRRGYQITRLRGEQQPVVFIDEQCDTDDAPATRPGLAYLVASTHRPDQSTPTTS